MLRHFCTEQMYQLGGANAHPGLPSAQYDINSPWHIFSFGIRTKISDDLETIVFKLKLHTLGVKFTFVIFFRQREIPHALPIAIS